MWERSPIDEVEEELREEIRAFFRQHQDPNREYLVLFSDRHGERVGSVEPPELQPNFIRTTAEVTWEDATPIDIALFNRLKTDGWTSVSQYGVGQTEFVFDGEEGIDERDYQYTMSGYAFERS